MLQWKLEKKRLQIDENQIARYANVSETVAEGILEELLKIHAVYIDIKVNCPKCFMSYTIDCTDKEFICSECGNQFIPGKYKHLGTVQKLFVIYLRHDGIVPFAVKIIFFNVYFG